MSGKNQNIDRNELLRAIADYMATEGCSCCRSEPEHSEAEQRIGKLLDVEKYPKSDFYFSGRYNFFKYSSRNQNAK